MQVRPYRNRERHHVTRLGEGRVTRTEDQEKSYESKPGVQETKTIVLTRKAPKKQRLAATGAHPEKEMAFHRSSGIQEPFYFQEKESSHHFAIKKLPGTA